MKKKILLSILITAMCMALVGCESNKGNNDTTKNTETKLNEINNEIIEYFSSNDVELMENMGFNYVDLTNNVVVVGLIDNSKAQQDKFRELVVDSEYIVFVQGQNFLDYN